MSSFYWQGKNTYKVFMSLHQKNRDKLLDRFSRIKVDANSMILLQGGTSKCRDDTDHELLFRQESFFHYLFGVMEPNFYGGIHTDSRKSYLFIEKLPPSYAVWLGEIKPPSFFKQKYEVDEVFYVDDIDNKLQELGIKTIYSLFGVNSDSGSETAPLQFNGIDKYHVDKTVLHPELCECRVIKTPEELDLMRYVNKISSDAHIDVMKKCKSGMKEYQLESLFQHYTYTHGGARNMSYTCICASGINSHVLHYGHAAAPNDREFDGNEMLLLDMGCEYHCYGSDITCSYPASGKFTHEQRQIYEIVLRAQLAVINAIKPGVLWPDMHRLAERTILGGLVDIGLLVGSVEEMMKERLCAIFMPHGLGHFLGIDTHDVGGYPKGIERDPSPGLKSLRTGRVLQEGMVVTVEPGLYFNSILIEESLKKQNHARFMVPEAIKKFYGFGGVRLEDDVIVTATGAENMTKCPRTVEEIEAVMAPKN